MQLNLEQKKLITSKLMGHSLLKGVAGSGKTTVGVNRALFLLKNYCQGENDKLLLVSFNKSLTSYIEHIYKEVEKENNDKDLETMGIYDKSKLEIVNIDRLIFRYTCKYKNENKFEFSIAKKSKQLEVLKQCIAEISKRYSDVAIFNENNDEFLLKEISWIKACNYLDINIYQQIDRLGRGASEFQEGPKKLLKNSRTREAIFELLVLYRKRMFAKKLCDFQDNALMAIKYLETHNINKYTHIIIDESQDLSKIQLDCLVALYDKDREDSSILFLADTAQSIYDTAWLVRGRNFTSIDLDMTGKSRSLSKNYRTTTQIAQAAFSLLKDDNNVIDDDNFVRPSLIDKQGIYPTLKGFSDYKDEQEYVLDLIKNELLKEYELKDIGIVARNKNILTNLKIFFDENNLESNIFNSGDKFDFSSEAVKLITMHSIKGLEFKAIILIGLNEDIIPNKYSIKSVGDQKFVDSMERKLLYVGMTRANEKLFMSYFGKPSKFLKEIQPEYLRLKMNARFRRFYFIEMDKFEFQENIADKNSYEELVRQWFISELKNTYKYKKELLEIERKVNLFSKMGSVDISVNINKNDKLVPYIFIECKQLNAIEESSINQLKSYMAVEPNVEYGVLTDGNKLIVINKSGDEINDIPCFDCSMLASSIEKYEYLDLKTRRNYDFIMDEASKDSFVLVENEEERQVENDELRSLNLYTKIACGNPINVTNDVEDVINLPKDWIGTMNDMYSVHADGESMIDAGINDGDIVVLKHQQVAESNDIVAVAIDGSVTLKRYWLMGSEVILKPENKDFEPIMLKADEISILGKAVGIIKRR